MALEPISNYPEVSELTDNDYLPVETPTGLRKIKGSAVGGEESNIALIEFEMGGSGPQSKLTCGEIRALAGAGKAFQGYMAAGPGITAYFNISTLVLDNNGGSLIISGIDGGSQTLAVVNLSASSDSDVFTMV